MAEQKLAQSIAKEATETSQKAREIAALPMLTIAIGVGFLIIVIYAVQAHSLAEFFSVATVGVLIAGAFLLAGALIGFLFGIPRSLQQERLLPTQKVEQSGEEGKKAQQNLQQASEVAYQANTNLEQISDWLTKIIVGVGLTQLTKLPDALQQIIAILAPGLGGFGSSEVFGFAILLYFSVCGFLFGYLWTRLYLAGALREADIKGLTAQVEAVARQFKVDEARREAEQMDVITTEWDELHSKIETLLDLNEVRTAIDVGRRYLKEKRYDTSLKIFQYIDTRVDETNDLYRKVRSNTGYSLIGLGKYEAALDHLLRIEPLDDGIHFRVWHAMAIAYCYHHLGDAKSYQEWLAKTKKMVGYRRNVSFFQTLYPDIATDLE